MGATERLSRLFNKKQSGRKKVQRIVFWAGLAIVLILGVINALYTPPIDDDFLHEFDTFDSYELVESDPAVYKVAQEGSDVGYLVFTSHYGYQSEITMASLVGLDGTLIETRTYSQNETPSYYRRLLATGFFKNNFLAKPIQDGFSIDTNVDAVSHATISSNACSRAIQKGVYLVGNQYINQEVADIEPSLKVGLIDIAVLGMFVLAILSMKFSKNKLLRWATRIYSVAVMGFALAQFVTLSVLVTLFSFDWPNVIDYLRWYILVFGVIILLLAFGKNLYCLYMCPFGAFQEMEASLSGKLSSKPLHPKLTSFLLMIPGALVLLALVIAFLSHNLGSTNYEPFSLLFGQVGVGVQWALLPIVLIGALFSKRFYCKFGCPVGFVAQKIILARSSILKLVKPNLKKAVVTNDYQAIETAQTDFAAGVSSESKRDVHKKKKASVAHKSRKFAAHDYLIAVLGFALLIISVATIVSTVIS